jgi:hypothetical protein
MVSFSAIDECKTDVYFANGILTDEDTAIYNALQVLKPAIQSLYGTEAEMKKYIGRVWYAYNETFEFNQDMFESGLQITNIQSYIDWWASKLLGYKSSIHAANLKNQVEQYKASILDGHKVLVVAHSQGNLFTQEAYEKLGKQSKGAWMQKYFEAVSIASPDPYSDIKPDMAPRIGWDNDMVAWLGRGFSQELGALKCQVRQVKWELSEAYILGEEDPSIKPTNNYVNKSDVDKIYDKWWRADEGWVQELDSNVHAFTFYMGLPLKEGDEEKENFGHVYINPFNNKPLIDDSAKPFIMSSIKSQLDKLEKVESQWKPKNLGCLCKDKYAKMTHIHDPDLMNIRLEDEKVKDFAEGEEGKIYSTVC